jgi:uncharacterized protein
MRGKGCQRAIQTNQTYPKPDVLSQLSPVRFAALFLTHNCNLRCTYCYAGPKTIQTMDSGTVRKSIDFLLANGGSRCVLTFLGGEPLLQFDRLMEAVRYAGEIAPGRFAFRMSTNGTLLDGEKLAMLAEHNVTFVLSVDGHPAQHDRNRVYGSGKGSYAAALGHLRQVLSWNPYTVAVSVIAPNTVCDLAEGVQHLYTLGFRYVLQSLDFSATWTRRDMKVLEREYKAVAGYYGSELRKNKKIYYGPFDERVRTWAVKPYSNGDLCDMANSQIAIAPSGRIYPCVQFVGGDGDKEIEWAIGDVFTGFVPETRRKCVGLNYEEKESCRGCGLLGRCMSYCGCVNHRGTGHINRVPPIVCEHERLLMPIVDALAEELWKDDVVLFKRKFYDQTFPISSFVEDCLALGDQALS